MLLVTCVDQLHGQASEKVWAWDGSAWQSVDSDGPPPMVVTAAAYDPDRAVVVRYGGLPMDSNTCVPETWEWDGADWSQVAPPETSRPTACDHMKLTYDASRRVMLLVGGGELQDLSAETWTWDGTEWALAATDGPRPRAHHGLVYDATHQQALLYGGYDGAQVFDDFWTWDGSAWEEGDLSDPGPRSHMGLAISPDSLLLFGGATGPQTFDTLTADTWLLTDGSWRDLDVEGPSPRGSPAMAHDPTRDLWVLYGGFGADGSELGDTWELEGPDWTCVDRC
jgi:hypothetical protein